MRSTENLVRSNSSPQSSQPPASPSCRLYALCRKQGLRPGGKTLRKKILNNLCVLSGLCGEILLGMAQVSSLRSQLEWWNTGILEKWVIAKALKMGADEYLHKPFTNKELTVTVRRAIRKLVRMLPNSTRKAIDHC